MLDLDTGFWIGALGCLFLGSFVMLYPAITAMNDYERRAQARLRTEGVRVDAVVKTFLRRSMTQHRVLLELRFPWGPTGREYLLSGLSDDWLAHHAALGIPVVVFAHPTASTVLFEHQGAEPVPTAMQSAARVLAWTAGVLVASAIGGALFSLLARTMR